MGPNVKVSILPASVRESGNRETFFARGRDRNPLNLTAAGTWLWDLINARLPDPGNYSRPVERATTILPAGWDERVPARADS